MSEEKLTLVDAEGNPVADMQLTADRDGWYAGKLLSQQLPRKLQEALDWYDEVVEHQMLSYLDQATAAVEHFGLSVRGPNGLARKVYSLHINKQNDVSFRTSPVPPPAWLTKSESA
jgi:hypothetical protein